MATGTKQQWRDLSRQLRENTTPRELGEAVLALAEGKHAAPRTDGRIWTAVVIGAVILTSIGVSREVTNSRALATQADEADRQAQLARDAQAEAEEATRRVEDYSLTIGEEALFLWNQGAYDGALALIEAAEGTGGYPAVGLRVLRDGPYRGDLEQMQLDFDNIKQEQ